MTKKKIPAATSRRPATFKPRFNFSAEFPSAPGEYATIGDLLLELSHELYPSDGIRVDGKPLKMMKIKDIETSLRFFRKLFGFRLKSVTESYPIEAIKTIKAIYNCNRKYNNGVIGWIEPLSDSDNSLIDILEAPRNKASAPLRDAVQSTLDAIGREIAPDDKRQINEMASAAGLRVWLEHLHEREIENVLQTHIPFHDELYVHADRFFSTAIRAFADRVQQNPPEPRIHVATYTYLKCLSLIHWLQFEIQTHFAITKDKGITNMTVDFTRLCEKVSVSHGKHLLLDTPFMSLVEFEDFATSNALEIAQLVSKATGYPYNARDVHQDWKRARIALRLYWDSADLSNPIFLQPIGIVHVVAAFCSVIRQRKHKSRPAPHNRSLDPRSLEPQKHLDNLINGRSAQLPYTTSCVYCERTKWYVHALLGRKDQSDVHNEVRHARRLLCKALVLTLDHSRAAQFLHTHGEEMRALTKEFLRDHGRTKQLTCACPVELSFITPSKFLTTSN